ncbi:MAG: uroporphyrinogen-III C-methyltransferase [Gammaproteobacteria bacterium]|nr:uroporphyrinogen-III C-methyltransferase [Gammaproteobacteria bacterium]
MSDKDKDQDETLASEEDAATEDSAADEAPEVEAEVFAEDAPVEDTVETVTEIEMPAKKRGGAVGWFALLLSILALGAVGYTFYEDWRGETEDGDTQQIAVMQGQLSAAQASLSELQADVDSVQQGGSSVTGEIDALRQELDERVDLLNSLPARISTLEGAVASFAGVSSGARDTWLLAEAEYYMQIANAQLQLANNPQLASLAMKMADERIVQMANPSLTDVRRAIADELAALDLMKKPDVEGATLTLASLARVVEALPLKSAPGLDAATGEQADGEQTGVDRAWSSVKSAVTGLVKVTPPEQARPAILTPDGEYFLRNNIALQLQSARLALLRGEQAIFEQTIDDTSALLNDYFDTDSAQVASTLDTLAEMRGSVFTTTAPDIAESLQLLRQFRTLSETPQ